MTREELEDIQNKAHMCGLAEAVLEEKLFFIKDPTFQNMCAKLKTAHNELWEAVWVKWPEELLEKEENAAKI